jgi:hypothetical protein
MIHNHSIVSKLGMWFHWETLKLLAFPHISFTFPSHKGNVFECLLCLSLLLAHFLCDWFQPESQAQG